MPGTVKSELLSDADRSHKCDSQEKVCWIRHLSLDKSHFITGEHCFHPFVVSPGLFRGMGAVFWTVLKAGEQKPGKGLPDGKLKSGGFRFHGAPGILCLSYHDGLPGNARIQKKEIQIRIQKQGL